jgi:hypothetical protein
VRPLCAMAVGGLAQADRLGLDSCPQVILASAKGGSPGDADNTIRAVAAIKAGLSDPSSIAAADALGTSLLGLTGIAKDAEERIASQLGPDNARLLVYGSSNCGHMVELRADNP